MFDKRLAYFFVFKYFFIYLHCYLTYLFKNMARNKKILEYSNYQKAIFDFVQNGQGNAIIEACAGSGKTFTLIKCLDFIKDDKKILMTAFNHDIVNSLKNKTKKIPNVVTMTMHGLGLQMLHVNYRKEKLELNEFKYASFISTNLKDLSTINFYKLDKSDYYKYTDNIAKYIDFGRFYLCNTINDLEKIEKRYEIVTIADEKSVALQAMEWGKKHLDEIDYADMIWLPNVLMCNPWSLQFDWIMIDECQDMNKAERELILKCRKINTRIISVGDTNQMIYSFSGADPESFNALKSLPNTVSLPLSISYRCADKIVEYAKQLVPTIEENSDKREGIIEENSDIEEVQDGDMVLCRNNAPLMKIYNMFIKEGKKCFVRGKDIGSNLKRLVKNTKQENLNVDLDNDGVFVRLYNNLFTTRDNLMLHNNIDYATAMQSSVIVNKLDIIHALEILSEGLTTSEELVNKISDVFSDRKKNGISLSTIHKAKGLEADRVFVACKSLMPSKSAKTEWEMRQEHNLMYVCYTRAKNLLGFINEDNFSDFKDDNQKEKDKLRIIEEKVNKVLGKKTKYLSNNIIQSNEIVKRAKKIELPKANIKTIKNDVVKIQVKPTLSGLFGNKIIRRNKI